MLHTSLTEERERDSALMRRGGAEALEQFASTLLKETDSHDEMTGFSIARSARQYAAMLRKKQKHDEVNMAFNDIISDSDIEKLTGYKIPSKQCACLSEAGVFFIIRRDGRPRTTWQHFNDPLSHHNRTETESHEPDFGALD